VLLVLVTVQPVVGSTPHAPADPCHVAWQSTTSLLTARQRHTATRLADGTVLVAGGTITANDTSEALASAELYDPATTQWRATGSLHQQRYEHTATLLSNGRVLVAGGFSSSNPLSISASAELYDPVTGQWTTTGAMHVPRALHTATLLSNGNVLVAGGEDNAADSAELYNPASGTWALTGDLLVGHSLHTATLLANDSVLIAGGRGTQILTDTEIYSPTSGLWSTTGSLTEARYGHTATALPDGSVLVVGGYQGWFATEGTERYDPSSGLWSSAGDLVVGRAFHTATLLANGAVLVVGGEQGLFAAYFAASEVYVPATKRWTLGPISTVGRSLHTATRLLDGTVLVAGGGNLNNEIGSVELYQAGAVPVCTTFLPLIPRE
jgi:N-acetylneuraminic acid mutarotase